MSNKTEFVEIQPRFQVRENKTEGIISYDDDNSYPQRMRRLVASSVTATSCLKLFNKFNLGRGFEDVTLAKAMFNSKQTGNKVLKAVGSDFSEFSGMAVHLKYNALMQVVSIKPVPFDYCRLTTDTGEHAGTIAVYEDWARELYRQVNKDLIHYIDEFTTDQNAIDIQIEKAGGFEQWKGHLLWFSDAGDMYPTPVYDPAIDDIETDRQIAKFKKSNAMTSFLASHFMFLQQEFEDDTQREEYMAQLNKFQGGENAGKFMLIDGVTEDNTPTIERIDVANNDRLFEYTETSSQNNIRKSFLAPKELIGDESSSGFDTEKISQAREYYNSITEPNRELISEFFDIFVPRFVRPLSLNTTIKELFTDKPITNEQPTDES